MRFRALLTTTAAFRALLTTTAAAAAVVAGHGLLGLLAILAYAWASSMITVTNTAKTRNVEHRVAAHVTATAPAVSFVANGGVVGGNVIVAGSQTLNGGQTVYGDQTISGDHHIQGRLYGTGGTVTLGDNMYGERVLTVAGTLTTHADLRGSSTTGVSNQGSALGNLDGDSNQGAAPSTYDQGAAQATITRVNNLIAHHNGTTSDLQATITRVNAILNAIG